MARWISRAAVVLLILVVWAVGSVALAVHMVMTGESVAARDLLVTTVMETSAAKFVAKAYLTEAQIAEILETNTLLVSEQISDVELFDFEQGASLDLNQITVEEVKGGTYKGKMMIVNDPSRVYIASPTQLGEEHSGLRVEEMVRRDGAVAGVNGGGFADEGGVGNGGMPLGYVISNGVLVYGEPDIRHTMVGFDSRHRLIVGRMTAAEALAQQLRDAVVFEPVGPLIVNGEPVVANGSGGGLNPRTAIGQRKDGAVLLLVIDGRQPHSLGASYKDLIDVMQQYGAVNAANLDGGSSSLMVYNDEIITVCASLYGSRKLPTAVLVK